MPKVKLINRVYDRKHNRQNKFTKEQLTELRKAVNNFNKKRNKLITEENKMYLPQEINYKYQKSRIETTKELNRYIKSLQAFNKQGAEKLVTLETGDIITKWQKQQIQYASRRAMKSQVARLEQLSKPTIDGKFSRTQMPDEEVASILTNIEDIEGLWNRKGESFKRLANRIDLLGHFDYYERKNRIYKENYLEMLKTIGAVNYENYDKFYNKIKNLSPSEFYDFVNKNKNLGDMRLIYDTFKGLVYSNYTMTNEENFNEMLQELEII